MINYEDYKREIVNSLKEIEGLLFHNKISVDVINQINSHLESEISSANHFIDETKKYQKALKELSEKFI